MIDFNEIWVDFECPTCGYMVDAQMIDVKTESTVSCHCCKTRIKLVDQDASTHTGMRDIESAMDDLENTLKNFGR